MNEKVIKEGRRRGEWGNNNA
jgi:hypothetical protein